MPTLETPPNPVESPDLPGNAPKLAAGRFGELDHSEIVHLLSTLDDEVARSRFRESVYISLIICLALAWFAFYGPRVLFHQGRIVDVGQTHKNELSYLETPKDLSKILPKPTKTISEHTAAAQTSHPAPTPPAPKPGATGGRNPHAPRPQPQQPQQQPQPQQPRPQPQQQQPVPPTPQPQRPQQATNSIPDAPRPQQPSTRPNFSTPTDPGQAIRDASRQVAQQHGQGGEDGTTISRGHPGANTGMEVLSDTMGTDFGPYLARLKRSLYNAWIPILPEETEPPICKKGMTLIRFTILPNGVVSAMHLDDSTRDQAIDRAAWGSITSQGQLPPLPSSFKGPNLELRFQYNVLGCGPPPTTR